MTKFTIFLLAAAILIFAIAVSHDATAATDSTKVDIGKLKHQTLCPVMNKPIDSAAYTDIQGQRVYHCCPGCAKALQANPDKYFEQAARDGILFENIQKTCPVSGKPIDKKYQTYYKGRLVYFSSADCLSKFNASPNIYLKKLDEATASKAKE
ncbi:hypothetical protein C3F09_07360 [candidate division GN15 bacterium]|uniref:TRASH domain-containing protein n=1 Tax=candidate division GN15 bacterium TaxID=2072418 RepID=A0A855X5D3_9BACT|nr:MAG: hypothetical protein C3F09_07360 [candidate division GN15 bacterium]